MVSTFALLSNLPVPVPSRRPPLLYLPHVQTAFKMPLEKDRCYCKLHGQEVIKYKPTGYVWPVNGLQMGYERFREWDVAVRHNVQLRDERRG